MTGLQVMGGGRDDNVYAYSSKCSFHLHINGTLAEYY